MVRGSRGLRSGLTRASAATLAAVTVLCLGSCSGEPSAPEVPTVQGTTGSDDSAGTGAASDDAVETYLARQQAYVDCARANGAPGMHDPDEFGQLVLGDLVAVQGGVAARIQRKCGKHLKGNAMPAALADRLEAITAGKMSMAEKQLEVDFATCMQENGVPSYPDPQANGLPTTPEWDLPASDVPVPAGLSKAREACLPLFGKDAGAE